MVQATLRALADLVPLLGADVVMGTSRIAVFADTKPRVREGEKKNGEKGIFWEAIYIFYFLSFRQMQFLLFPSFLPPTLFLLPDTLSCKILPDTLSCKILPAPAPQPGRRGRNR